MNKLETEVFYLFYLNVDFPFLNLRKNYDSQVQKMLEKNYCFHNPKFSNS